MTAGLISSISSINAATIAYDFDDADGVVDSNNFTDVSAEDWIITSAGGTAFQNGRAEGGQRDTSNGPGTQSFTIVIGAAVTADFTSLSFERGFNETIHPNTNDPAWVLTMSTGSADVMSGVLPTVVAIGYTSSFENLTLSGLTGLTDTTVTFTFDFTDPAKSNSLARADTMDNVVLTGTFAAVPEPSSTALLGLGGLALIMRRRK